MQCGFRHARPLRHCDGGRRGAGGPLAADEGGDPAGVEPMAGDSGATGGVKGSLFPFGGGPGGVGVVGGQGGGEGGGFWAEVFLPDFALLVDNESHHAGIAPFLRPGDQGETSQHAAVDDVIIFAGGRVGTLPG